MLQTTGHHLFKVITVLMTHQQISEQSLFIYILQLCKKAVGTAKVQVEMTVNVPFSAEI